MVMARFWILPRSAVGLVVALLLLLPVQDARAFFRPPEALEAAVAARARGACSPHVGALHALAAEAGPTGARAGYVLAHCLEALNRDADAYHAFLESADRYPPVASHARYHAGRIALKLDRAADALAALEPISGGSVPPPLFRRVRLLRADALLRSERPAEALSILQSLVHEEELGDEELALAWWLLGAAAEGTRDRRLAARAYGMAWWAVPGNRHAADAVRRLRLIIGGAPVPPADARIVRGRRLLKIGQPEAAERELLAGLRGRPAPDLAADAWLQVGLLRGGGRRAVSSFQQAARYPHQAARAQYWLGRSLLAAGRTAEGHAVLWGVADRFGVPWAPRALLVLARSAEGDTQTGGDRILTELVRRFPDSPSADEARWRRGWFRYRARKFADAEAIFLDAARRYPASQKAAANLYWAAKAKEAQGREAWTEFAEVARRYPMTFYGQRASARLGVVPGRPAVAPEPMVLPAQFQAAVAELDALGFEQEAAEAAETEAVHVGGPEMLRVAAAIRLKADQVDKALRWAEPAISPSLFGGQPGDAGLWMLAYPRAHWESVRQAAQAAGIDPYLVLAVIREESRFDARAFSIARAVGLMQLLPATAVRLAGGPVTVAQLIQPEVNVRLGAAYLSGLLRRFRGDVVLAVAGYNAGPGAARRFARSPRADPDVFFERIPFVETRAYVQHVLQSYGIYRWLYRN